jgi:probable rRNA maturation factor
MILNRQRRIRIPMGKLRKFLSRAQRQLRLPADSVTVCLVTDAEIAHWNRAYRRKPGATDVLSFPAGGDRSRRRRSPERAHALPSASLPLSPTQDGSPRYLGDIAIAPSVAERNARLIGRKLGNELCTLILHGLLHLMGYDHETDTGQMDRRERQLRRTLGLA